MRGITKNNPPYSASPRYIYSGHHYRGKMEKKHIRILLDEGFTETEANKKMDAIYSEAAGMLAGYKNQAEFESHIIDSTKPDPNKITPSAPLRLLPGVIECAPFDIDIRRLMLAIVSHDGSWERTKWALRFLALWKNKVAANESAHIIHRLMETDEYGASRPLALYTDKILDLFSDDPRLVDDIFEFILENNQSLALLSATPVSAMPFRFRQQVKKWIPFRKTALETEKVISVRHVDNFAGTCSWMADGHNLTLISGKGGPYPDSEGDITLLYVENKLIGSMKHFKDRSILGLRYLRDPEGRFPLITGGVYVTTTELTIRAENAFREQGKYARLHIDELPLFPLEFVWADAGPGMVQDYAELLGRTRRSLE